MIPLEFRKKIGSVTGYRDSRQEIANEVIENQGLFLGLLQLCFQVSDKNHSKACWLLELVCYEKLEWLQPHLDFFCNNINVLTNDSAIRPIAKICQLLVISHFKEKNIQLSENHLELLIETNFDWLINDVKVAPKAYSIRTLFLLGNHFDWIHPELKTIVSKDFADHSAAYKAVAKEVLKKIK
ncbi:hypothetical protein [Flavobacterium adhaerens]|uniref:hypothetical protein n=1 Tax=Flavobacterium adhaerens TaxID=3149043 RepID=UPI0032B4C659